MQTSIVFLGVISAVLIGSQLIAEPTNTQPAKNIAFTKNDVASSLTWKVMITGSDTSCKITKTPATNNAIKPNYITSCDDTFPGIDALGRIDTDTNGNITLYSVDGKKLALFMESESGFHESVWPQYPLMTLAKIN